jgi:hypothetical protein
MGLLARGSLCIAYLAFILGLPIHILAQERATGPTDQQQTPAVAVNALSSSLEESPQLPDSPGAEWAKSQADSSQQEGSSQPTAQAASQPQAADTADQKLQHPVGTAAAEAPKVSGITAAQPAGVAIAPAKQRRVRTIVLKVGAIIGAGAAIGAVIALSEATPSKPPGAH